MPRLAVVILTWNGRSDTLACLDTLRGEVGPDDAAVVCDNGSADDTEAAVRERHPWVEFIQNGANLGFAGGNNPGLKWALGRGYEWVLLLNSDTLVPAGSLAALLEYAQTRPATAAFQPLLVSPDEGAIDGAGQVVFGPVSATDDLRGRPIEEAPREPRPIFGACAAAALLRAKVLAEVGLFDEGFFVSFEDVDLMLRIRAAGHGVELVPSVRIKHRRGVSASGDGGKGTWPRQVRFWTDRNLVALALGAWPAQWLVRYAPRMIIMSCRALRFSSSEPGQQCLPLWRRHLAKRRATRKALVRHGVDAWFRPPPPRK